NFILNVDIHLLILNITIDITTTYMYNLSLHDALPICTFRIDLPGPGHRHRGAPRRRGHDPERNGQQDRVPAGAHAGGGDVHLEPDRKSTRLNSSHVKISYAVFCLKKKIKY